MSEVNELMENWRGHRRSDFIIMKADDLVPGKNDIETAAHKGWGKEQSGIVHYVSLKKHNYKNGAWEEKVGNKRMAFGSGSEPYSTAAKVSITNDTGNGHRHELNLYNHDGWVKLESGKAVGGSDNWESLAKEKRHLWVFK